MNLASIQQKNDDNLSDKEILPAEKEWFIPDDVGDVWETEIITSSAGGTICIFTLGNHRVLHKVDNSGDKSVQDFSSIEEMSQKNLEEEGNQLRLQND